MGGLNMRLKADIALVATCKAAKLSAPDDAQRSPDKLLEIMGGVFQSCEPLRSAVFDGSPIGYLDVVALYEVGSDPESFEPTLQRALADFDPAEYIILVWMEGSSGPGAVPWCPDTRAQLPALARALYRGRGKPIVLVSANVLPDEMKRWDSRLQLTGVPTLYRWDSKGPTRQLDCTSRGCAEWNAEGVIAALIDS